MRIRPRFIIGAALIVAAVAYLIASAIRSTSEYYLTVAEAGAREPELAGQPVRIAGRVRAGGLSWDPATLTLKFAIEQIPDAPPDGDGAALKKAAGGAVTPLDGDGAALKPVVSKAAVSTGPVLRVICAGQPRPDMFAPGRDVIVEGKLDKTGMVTATQVLTSCPSKYRPKQGQ